MPKSIASEPAYGAFGNSPGTNSALRCPGQANENFSVLKDFSLGAEDRYKLQFRLEFYNLFNRHYYNIVGCAGTRATAGDSEFGWISGVAENPRTGQFGVRFEF